MSFSLILHRVATAPSVNLNETTAAFPGKVKQRTREAWDSLNEMFEGSRRKRQRLNISKLPFYS